MKRPRVKKDEQIADAIFAHGEVAFSAAKFPQILNDEIRAAGYADEADIAKAKTRVALVCVIRRRSRRAA